MSSNPAPLPTPSTVSSSSTIFEMTNVIDQEGKGALSESEDSTVKGKRASSQLSEPIVVDDSDPTPTPTGPNSSVQDEGQTHVRRSQQSELVGKAQSQSQSQTHRPPTSRHYTYPGKGTASNPYLIDFGPSDPTNPYNWSNRYRWFLTLLIGVTALCPPFTSVSYSSTVLDISREFGMSRELATAGISLFILGTAIGPLVWAPFSEIHGRVLAFNVSYPLFTAFNLGLALAKDTRTLMVMRFLSGLFGSSTLTNAGGQVGDMWAAHERAMATSIFSLAPFLGPVLGPIVGGFVTQEKGYRWVYWIQFIYAAVITVVCIAIQPETYAPTILRRQAAALTRASAEEGTNILYIAKYDQARKTPGEIVKEGLLRPFELLFTEVIVGCLAIYGAIVYGILYLFFACFPLIYQETRGWSVGQGGLAFLGMGLGLIIGNAICPLGNVWYRRATKPGRPTPPEARLPLALIASVLCPIGLFWFAWTSAPPVHWIWSILACIPFGCAFILIFAAIVNYIIDSYTLHAASALAAQAVLRCLFGAAFPLFANKMYRNLGLHWAGTLVAFLSLLCAPMPFLFYRYGAYLRRKSRYAPSTPVNAGECTPEGRAEIEQDEIHKVRTRESDALEPQWGARAGERAREGGEGVREETSDVEKGRV